MRGKNSKHRLHLVRAPKFCTTRDFRSWLRTSKKHKKFYQKWDESSYGSWWDSLTDVQRTLDLYLSNVLEKLREYLDWMASTPYSFNVQNDTTVTLSDVVWAYRRKDGVTQMQVLQNVTPGNTAHFEHPSCIGMVDYAFSVYVDGVEEIRSETMTVEDVNNLERQALGQIAMCEDTWIIAAG